MRKLALIIALGGAACSGDATVSVALTTSSSAIFDPFQGATALRKVRVSIDGTGQYDDAAADLASGAKTTSFTFPSGSQATVTARGYDELGNLVAFGTSAKLDVEGDVSVSIPFHRNLAFVTHYPEPNQRGPDGKVYVLDVATRTYVTSLQLPGTSPGLADFVGIRGGESVMVTYIDGGKGYVGELSTANGEWTPIPLNNPQQMVLAAPGQKHAIGAGGGWVTIIDLEQKKVVAEFDVGGEIFDGAIAPDYQSAVFATSATPGVLIVRLHAGCLNGFARNTCISSKDVPEPSGVALAADGRNAFITSSANNAVYVYDFRQAELIPFDGSFSAPVGAAAFSSDIQSVVAVGARGPGCARVLGFVVPLRDGTPANAAPPTFPCPVDIAADPSGLRLVVVSDTGTSTSGAGLTVIEGTADVRGRVSFAGSSGAYPTDPSDTYMESAFVIGHQRYRPRHVGILNGR